MEYKIEYNTWWGQFEELNRHDPGTRFRNELIANELQKHKFKSILDIGCGSGELLILLHQVFPDRQLFGTDVSKNALKILGKKKVAEKTFLIDLERDSKGVGKFDAVICSEVIEHVKNDRNVYKFISNCCNKGSFCIVTTQSGRVFPHNRKMGHLRHYTIQEISGELNKLGFKIIMTKSLGWPFMNLKNYIVSYILKDGDYGKNSLSLANRIGLKLFYFLYKVSDFGFGPQIMIVAVKSK